MTFPPRPLLVPFVVWMEQVLLGEAFEEELGLPGASEMPSKVDDHLLLVAAIDVVDVAVDKPEMDVLDIIVLHLVFQYLADVNLLR